MTSLFARNERLLWRTRFSTTEMPSQFLTQYNTIESWQFSLFSLKLSLQSTHVHVVHWNGGRAVCRLHGMQSADCTRFPDCMEHLYSSAKFFIIFLLYCLLHICLSCLIELYLYPLCFYVATSISLQTTLSSQHTETVARLTATQQQLTSTRQELASSRQDVTRLEETVQVVCVVKRVFGWTWWWSTAWCGILTKLCTTNSILSSGLVYWASGLLMLSSLSVLHNVLF